MVIKHEKDMICTVGTYKFTGLIYECPARQVTSNCPFTDLRKKGFSEGIREFFELDPDKQLKLIEHHQRCIVSREII
jgi:hypothetical protein